MSGVVVWFVGLPSSGKTTIAAAVREELRAHGGNVCMLDGDEVRTCIDPPPGYAPEQRDAFYVTLTNLAVLLAKQGLIVLVPATANRRRYRQAARQLAPSFIEIFIDAPLSVCRERDTKGLYKQSGKSALGDLPGAGTTFETPKQPELTVSRRTIAEAVEAVVRQIVESRGQPSVPSETCSSR